MRPLIFRADKAKKNKGNENNILPPTTRIIAINNDPEAPIFDIAHYPIVGDIYDEVPKLIDAIRNSK